jgi:hypothetical protein
MQLDQRRMYPKLTAMVESSYTNPGEMLVRIFRAHASWNAAACSL